MDTRCKGRIVPHHDVVADSTVEVDLNVFSQDDVRCEDTTGANYRSNSNFNPSRPLHPRMNECSEAESNRLGFLQEHLSSLGTPHSANHHGSRKPPICFIQAQNLDSLLEHAGFDQAAYSQKRNGFLIEIKALDQKLKDTRQELDELKKQKTQEAEFTKLMPGADPFKTLTYRIINLPFADKLRLLRGVLDGPIVVGRSTLNPHVGGDPEDEMMKILEGIEMSIRHNHPLLL